MDYLLQSYVKDTDFVENLENLKTKNFVTLIMNNIQQSLERFV